MIRGPRSLRVAFTWWFAGTLVLLYGVTAVAVWFYARTTDRHYAILTLKAEAETVAAYLATTGRLDAPELAAPEKAPFRIWFRIVRDGTVLAETPGMPALRQAPTVPPPNEFVTEWTSPVRGPYLIVYHAVGGAFAGATIAAIAPMGPLLSAQHRLGAALVLIGLVVIPIAALGGRMLALNALRPIVELVGKIRARGTSRLGERLEVSSGAHEVAVLANAFNDLLGRLDASVERMRRFTADASHEIRNPLSVLRTGLEVTLRRPRPPQYYREVMQENLDEIARLQAVLEGLLVLARDVPGEPPGLTRVPVDVSQIVAQTVDTFATVVEERGVRIDRDIEPELIVEGDAHMLGLVAFNLLDNAVKYGPPGGTIRVSARARPGAVVLVVADEGPGVVEEDRPQLFRRFSRGTRSTAAGIGGLGLSVVCWVADLHGGTVELLDSERGAAFEVTLPTVTQPSGHVVTSG